MDRARLNEILGQQLELLAESSEQTKKYRDNGCLVALSHVMCEVAAQLNRIPSPDAKSALGAKLAESGEDAFRNRSAKQS